MSKMFEALERLEGKTEAFSAELLDEMRPIRKDAPPVAHQERAPSVEPRMVPFVVPQRTVVVDREPAPARPSHRILAEAFDASMVLIALGLFLGIFFLSGGGMVVARHYAPLFASVLAILAIFYRFLWVLANHDTPGTRFAKLRVVDAKGNFQEVDESTLRPVVAQTMMPLAQPKPAGSNVRPIIEELVLANRILANEGVLDAYGHVSVRDDRNPNRFFLARHSVSGPIMAEDIIEYDLDSKPITGDPSSGYAERFIHGEIYRAQPGVMAIVHCHAPEAIPFGASNVPLLPISHMAAFLAEGVPVFEIRESAGVTDMMIRTPALGRALAETLGDKPAALLRGHGAVVVASSLHTVVGRAYYMNENARLQQQAIQLGGSVTYLAADEAREAAPQDGYERAWELWKQKATLPQLPC